MKKKDVVILVAATIIPFGYVALGLWKAYELVKKKEQDGTKEDKSNSH